jgi:V/A-type H+-transporting ATPase subunit I
MIVPMKKVTLVCLDTDRNTTLRSLREVGVLHLVSLSQAVNQDVEKTEARLAEVLSCAKHIADAAGDNPADTAPGRFPSNPCDLVRQVLEDRLTAEERLAEVEEERLACGPLGDFDPDTVRRLGEKGVTVSLFVSRGRKVPPAPDGFMLRVLGRNGAGVFFALIGAGTPEVDAHPVPLPARRLSAIRADELAARAEVGNASRRLAALAGMLPSLREEAESLKSGLSLHKARAGMADAGRLSALQGFCPRDRIAALRKAAGDGGWGLVVEDPLPDDNVPTLIRNPAFIRPIRLMFELIGVTPGYREADISAAFLVFYSVFFAMLVGDAGYGLLFLALTLTLRFAARKAPRDMIRLLLLLSVCTIAWGSLTGSWFGSSRLPALLDTARLPWLADDRNLMGLCFLIGSIHLTVAHLWSAVRTINRPVAIAQLGWIGMTWTMFLMARSLILDYPVPSFTLWMFLGSLAAIVLFMTPPGAIKHSWPDHVMLPLTVIGNFGDVVSYVRLFAVGSAGAAISQAFNEMALGNGIPTVWAGLSAALILFAAHTLNILLCALGVIVHGVRLNTLEFCSHMGIQWSGFKYRPFSRESAGETA